MNNRGFVSRYGLLATIIVTVVGVGVFSYPSRMANEVETDGWFVTLLAGVLCYFLLLLILRVIAKNEGLTFYEILECNLGKLLSKIFGLILCAYFVFSVASGMRVFAEVIKMYLLDHTPTEFILLVMIFTGLYLVRGELSALIKFNEIALFAMFVPMILILLFSTRAGKINNVLPLLQSRPDQYIKSLATATYAFGGIEIAYLVLPYMKERKGVKKTLLNSMIFITVFYAAVTILCLMFFTKDHTKELLWPTITLIRAIVIPGAFIERWEGLVMALWVLFYFTTFVNMYYFSGDILKQAFHLHDIKLSSLIIAPFVYILALYPENIAEVYDLSEKVTPILSVFTFIVLPLILIFASSVKGRGRKRNEA